MHDDIHPAHRLPPLRLRPDLADDDRFGACHRDGPPHRAPETLAVSDQPLHQRSADEARAAGGRD